jgi:hypothetical protein
VGRSLLLKASALASLVSSLFASVVVHASTASNGAAAAQGSLSGGAGSGFTVQTIIRDVTNTLIFFVGAISVIVLIIGGIRYIVSGGNSSSVEGAKNTILYAVVGIVVSVAAYAIVTFVLNIFN